LAAYWGKLLWTRSGAKKFIFPAFLNFRLSSLNASGAALKF